MLLWGKSALIVGTSYVVVYLQYTFVHLAVVTHFCASVKADLKSVKMVVLTLSISLSSLVGIFAGHFSVIGIERQVYLHN